MSTDTTPAGTPSPLEEAKPNSLQEIFNAAPDSLTDDQLDAVILELRRMRGVWEEAEAQGKKRGQKSKLQADPGMSLKDLGL